MSRKLDQELAEAIESSEAQAPDDDAPALTRAALDGRQAKPRRKGNWGLLIVLFVMVGGIASLMLVGFNDAAVYAVDVQKVRQAGAELVGRKLRVEGELVPGTLEQRDDPCEFRFVMHVEDAQLAIRYPKCVIPDTFRDRPEGGVMVTVEGTLTSEEQFDATLVMAKCASKYDPATRGFEDPSAEGSAAQGTAAPGAGDKPAADTDDGTIR